MDFKNFTSRSRPIDGGIQYINFFPNGYGVSVVRHDFSHTNDNTWELAVLKGNADKWNLCYNTPITNDVLGYMSDDEVNETCIAIANL